MDGFVLQVRKSWRLYIVIPLFSFQNWALLHPFLNMFTKSVKHVSIGLSTTSTYPFSWPFSNLFDIQKLPPRTGCLGRDSQPCFASLLCKVFRRRGNLEGRETNGSHVNPIGNQTKGMLAGVVLYRSAPRKRWSLHQHDKHRKRWRCSLNSASAKMLLCSTCDTRIQTKSNLPSNVSQQLLATTRIDIDLASASLALHDFSWHFSMISLRGLILQSSLKYLTSTNCCGSGSPWAKKTHGLNSWDFQHLKRSFMEILII